MTPKPPKTAYHWRPASKARESLGKLERINRLRLKIYRLPVAAVPETARRLLARLEKAIRIP